MKKLLLKLLGVDNLSKTTIEELAELYIKDLRKLLGNATRKSDIKKLEDAIAKRPEVVKQKAESRGLLKPQKARTQGRRKRATTTTETEPVVERKKSPVTSKKKTRRVSKPETTTTETKSETPKDKNQLEFKFKKPDTTLSAQTRKQIKEAEAKVKAKREAAQSQIRANRILKDVKVIPESLEETLKKARIKPKSKSKPKSEDAAYHKKYYGSGLRKGGIGKRPQMMHGGSHKSKKHAYAAGGSVKELKLFK